MVAVYDCHHKHIYTHAHTHIEREREREKGERRGEKEGREIGQVQTRPEYTVLHYTRIDLTGCEGEERKERDGLKNQAHGNK